MTKEERTREEIVVFTNVYQAVIKHFERLEFESKISDKARNMAQTLAADAVALLRKGWVDKSKGEVKD